MTKIKYAAIALAVTGFTVNSAMAQSSKANAWEGAYGQVGIGYESFSPSASGGNTAFSGLPGGAAVYNGTVATNNAASTSNANGLAGNVALGYNFGINQNYVLGLGAAYYPGASSAGNANNTATCTAAGTAIASALGGSCASSTTPGNYNVKGVYSIFLSPGYAIDKDRLIYAKVGYTGATVYLSSTQTNTNLTGYSLGLGYKQIVTGQIYAFVEANYAAYGSKTVSVANYPSSNVTSSVTLKGTGSDALVGLGYRF